MAVIKDATKYVVKVDYKPSYDQTGTLELPAYSQSFTKVREDATAEQLKNFADALMSLTIYRDAPYVVKIVDTSELVVA